MWLLLSKRFIFSPCHLPHRVIMVVVTKAWVFTLQPVGSGKEVPGSSFIFKEVVQSHTHSLANPSSSSKLDYMAISTCKRRFCWVAMCSAKAQGSLIQRKRENEYHVSISNICYKPLSLHILCSISPEVPIMNQFRQFLIYNMVAAQHVYAHVHTCMHTLINIYKYFLLFPSLCCLFFHTDDCLLYRLLCISLFSLYKSWNYSHILPPSLFFNQ